MKITIAYLYYDLLNLYGDSGNIKALEKHLIEQKINVKIEYISLNEKKEFKNYDVIYIGSGTEESLLLALKDLLKYKKELENFINDDKIVISTGNSLELFGKYIENKNEKYECLNILDFYTTYNENRIVKDVYLNCNFLKSKIIGFENHPGIIFSNEKPLFENEGILKNNFYGTYILGPILIRNPIYCKYIIKKIIKNKNKNFKLSPSNYNLEEKAYKTKIESIT